MEDPTGPGLAEFNKRGLMVKIFLKYVKDISSSFVISWMELSASSRVFLK